MGDLYASKMNTSGPMSMAVGGWLRPHGQSLLDRQAKHVEVESVDDVLAHLAPASKDDGKDEDRQREQGEIDDGEDDFAPVIQGISLGGAAFAVEFADE